MSVVPDVIGLSEVTEIIGCSKARVYNLPELRTDFPAPIARLRCGSIWLRSEIEVFAAAYTSELKSRTKRRAA